MKSKLFILTAFVIGLLIGIFLGWFFWGRPIPVFAKPPSKVDICHIDGKSGNSQTLNLPADTASKEHLDIHDLDYSGKCVECGEGQYDNKGTCLDKTHVCTNPEALNYDAELDERTEISDSEVCKYPEPSPKPPKDYCKNFKGDQKEIPYGMVSVKEGKDLICKCAEGFHQVDGEDLLRDKKEYDTFTCEKDKEPVYEPEGQCTTQCGLGGGIVPDGKGGTKSCPVNPPCGGSTPFIEPACKDLGVWSPTITKVWRVDNDTVGACWTKPSDNADSYEVWYGKSQDKLVWNTESKDLCVELNGKELTGHIWFKVAAKSEGCVGRFSVTTDP